MRLPIPTMKRHEQQQGNMSYLPPEMIEDILLKLPVKSLIRFRCLSKSWHSLITHPSFARMYVNHILTTSHHNNSLIFRFLEPYLHLKFVELGETQRQLDLPNIVSPDRYFTVTGCCDGILCLVQGHDTLVLWNPRIGDYKRLTVPESFDGQEEAIGFGYDSSIDDYKVVRVKSDTRIYPISTTRGRPTVVEVLTLKSNLWRRVYDDFPFIISSSFQQFICANGGLYWLANATELGPISIPKILCFDLAEEKFSEVPLPTGLALRNRSLGILGGCLCMFSSTIGVDGEFDLWLMNGDTWVKLLTIPKFSGTNSKNFLLPLGFTKDGVVFTHLDFANLKVRKFVTYEPKDSTFRKFTVDGEICWFKVTVYAESLVSPCASNGTGSQYLAG